MDKRKMRVTFLGFISIVVMVVCLWGSVTQAAEETMKCRTATTSTRDERIPVGDEEGHVLGLAIMEGLAFFENGEIAKVRSHTVYDAIPGRGAQAIGYTFYTFEDGSTIVATLKRLFVSDRIGIPSAKTTGTSELIKGTGRFEGIEGTASSTGKSFLASKGEATRSTNDVTFTYTLRSK